MPDPLVGSRAGRVPPTQPFAVGYVVSRWGEPTQTFVRREAGAISAMGVDLRVWSIKDPLQASGAGSVTHFSARRVGLGLVSSLVRRPVSTLRILTTILRHSSARNIAPQLAAAATGIAWAEAGIDVDHLHCHFGWVATTATWAAATISNKPFSVTLHAFDIHTERLQDDFAGVPLRAAKDVYCISRLDADDISHRWGIDTAVCHMGVPESWIERPRRVAADGSRSADLIVSVGSLVPKKGHADLIRAVARSEGWRLAIIGEGPERESLEALVEELGVGARIELLGACSENEVRGHLGSAAVAALACRVAKDGDRDGIPVALIEAMACGTPVITTRLGGIPELVEGAGILAMPGDVDSLVSALDEMRDPGSRDRIAVVAQERVIESWTVESSAGELLSRIRPSS